MPNRKKLKEDSRRPRQRLHSGVAQVDSVKLFYISAALLLLATIFLTLAYIIQQNTPKLDTTPAPFSGYSLNTPVTMGLATMEITKVTLSNGQPGFTSPANLHYVIVDFMVKNNADHPIDVLPSSDTYVKDQSGKVSFLTPFELELPFRAGTLLPGEQVKGQLSYIAAKTGSLKFFVDGIWSGGVVSFKIQ